MRNRLYIFIIALLFALAGNVGAQEDSGPVMIKINRIVFTPANKYTLYIPTFEFHMFFQKEFGILKSAVTADYDYQRQDMGFGMSHALSSYAINPGVSVDDNLYFREVFSDSTGIWRRKQAVTPFLMHEVNENTSVGLEFKIEREWSPNRRMGTKIVSQHDRSMKLYYLYQTKKQQNSLFYISFERSYKIFQGKFNYFLLECLAKYSHDLSSSLRYRGIVHYRGNITPQTSPLFFLGGRSNLIGYENDELWGRKAVYFQNLISYAPFPDFKMTIDFFKLRRLSLLYQIGVGRVMDSGNISGFKRQDDNLKVGLGTGIGFNTDLPYMPETDVHFILAVPSEKMSDVKYYFGFGGWMD